jgi:uncharacterized protein
MRSLRLLAGAVVVGMALGPLAAQTRVQFPKPTGYVNDFANLLDDATRAELAARLREVEQRTTAEIALATVPSLQGMSVEEYANRLFAAWGVGQKAADNGVLVVVAPNDRSMRIEVGYGLEPVLPDGLAGEIVRTEFLPRFRENDYVGGIRRGMRRVADVVETRHVLTAEERQRLAGSSEESSDDPPLWILLPFLGAFIAIGSTFVGVGVRTRTFFGLLFGALFALIPLAIALAMAFVAASLTLVPLALAMFVVGYRLGNKPSWRAAMRGATRSGSSDSSWIMGDTSSGSSGSGGSSDSFSGGSSGGGGASGRW